MNHESKYTEKHFYSYIRISNDNSLEISRKGVYRESVWQKQDKN